MSVETFYERVGGEAFFTSLVNSFYEQVPSSPLLAPMYPLDDLAGANQRLRLFLMQYWGGPTTYDELRGHPRLRMRHMPYTIDIAARDAWMEIMTAAVKAQNISADLEAELMDYLQSTARFLINTGEDEQIKWGNPNESN
jgi:hemoglobin